MLLAIIDNNVLQAIDKIAILKSASGQVERFLVGDVLFNSDDTVIAIGRDYVEIEHRYQTSDISTGDPSKKVYLYLNPHDK